MKSNISQITRQIFFLFGAIFLITFSSCEKEAEPAPDPVASFQYEISDENYLEVSFTSFSQNAVSYNWNFGDGGTSTEENPTHIYDEVGTYEVTLTIENSDGVTSTFSESIEITDPDEALKKLTGETSKTWKLYREGTSMGVGGINADTGEPNFREWWALENDGSRPCMYLHEFTFHLDGTYVFDDKGVFWGEGGVFPEALVGQCFEAVSGNMFNDDGVDVSAWLVDTHVFEYDPATGMVTITGEGAWIGLPKVATDGEVTVPQNSVTFEISIEEHDGYDLMHVVFLYDWGAWDFSYASYSDPSLEPELVEVAEEYGEDLEDLTPTEMYNTFAALNDFVLLDTAAVYPGTESAGNGVNFIMGVDDPAGEDILVGEYVRVGEYQELQFMQEYDIQFDNFTTVSLDVYIPGSNTYEEDGLTKGVSIIIAEASQTEQWWTDHIQYDVDPDAVVMDEWQTWTFQLNAPTSGAGDYTPYDRTDLDFIAISIGGGGHTETGTFYIRNFKFE